MVNRMQLSDIDNMQIGEIAKLHVSQLALLSEDADAMAKKAKQYKDWLTGAIAIKYGEAETAMRKAEGKDTGTIHLSDDGYDIESVVKKDVVWDNTKLAAAFDAMDHKDAEHYCKVKLEVEERKFTAAPPAIQALLLPARTLKAGKPTFKVTQKESA